MGLLNFFRKQTENEPRKRLPFVMNIGHERLQGKAPKKNQAACVAEYRSWPYAAIQRNAFSIARLELELFQKTMTQEGKQLDLVIDHPFYDLMKNVNPHMNKFELWTITVTFLELTGNAYWWVPKGPLGIPGMIWNLPAHWMRVVPDKKKFIAGYVMKIPETPEVIPFDEEEIIHFKYPNPRDMFYGASPMQAAQYGVDINNNTKIWGINFFGNNAQPSGVLSTENALNTEQYQRLRDQWNKMYKGSGNAGKMALLERGLTYQKTGSNLSDIDITALDLTARNEILAIYGVPASILGLVEDVNRANAEANEFVYNKYTIFPRSRLIEEKLNEKLIPMYDDRLIVKFENPIPEDKEFRLKEQNEHIKSGYSSIDDERAKDNEEPYNEPETQKPLIPFNLVPAGSSLGAEAGTAPEKMIKSSDEQRRRKWRAFDRATRGQENIFAGIMKTYFERQHSEVIKNIDKIKGIAKDLQAEIILNLNEEVDKLSVTSEPHIREAYVTGVKLAGDDLGIDFDIFNPNVTRAIDRRINFFANKVNDTTFKLISDELTKGLEAGETMAEIAKRIDKVFAFRELHSSKLTAQTEVIGAVNEGQLASYIEAGVGKKEWITAGDEKVRSSHSSMDGQIVGVTELFTTGNGNKLLHPGDRSTNAPAGEVINCRCTVNPVVEA